MLHSSSDTCIKVGYMGPTAVTIDNCTCVNTFAGDGTGIYVIGCDALTIINCNCYNHIHTGIRTEFCGGLWLENNTCYNNADEGMFIDNASDNGMFKRNYCYGNARYETWLNLPKAV